MSNNPLHKNKDKKKIIAGVKIQQEICNRDDKIEI